MFIGNMLWVCVCVCYFVYYLVIFVKFIVKCDGIFYFDWIDGVYICVFCMRLVNFF